MDKRLIELMECLKPYTPNERLEMLLEAANIVGLPELSNAILEYWEEALTTEDYISAQEESIKAQFKEVENKPDRFCNDCACLLTSLNTVKIELQPPTINDDPEIIYICSDCDTE